MVALCSKVTNTVLFLKHGIDDFSTFLPLSTSNVSMSEGTFCRVEVQLRTEKHKIELFTIGDGKVTDPSMYRQKEGVHASKEIKG